MADVPVAIWGKPGLGKTKMVTDFAAELGWELFRFGLAEKDASDLGGLPFPDDEKRKVIYLEPPLLPFGSDKNAIVFFDEADRAPLEVQNASLQLWQDREVNGHRFGPNVRVVVAGNATTDVGTTPLTEAAANRACHIYIKPDMEAWQTWAGDNAVSVELRGFARFREEVWHGKNSKPDAKMPEMAVPSPRSWVMADRIRKAAAEVDFETEDILPALLAGCVGEGPAIEWLAYCRLYAETPPIDQIIADPKNVPVPAKPDMVYALGLALVDHAAKHPETADAFAQYGLRWPKEPAQNFFRRLLAKQPKVITSAAYQEWDAGNRGERVAAGQERLTDVTSLTPQLEEAFKDGKITLLPSNPQWDIRLLVPSKSDPQHPHTVARRRGNNTWACDCQSWIRRRSCGHLTELGLS